MGVRLERLPELRRIVLARGESGGESVQMQRTLQAAAGRLDRRHGEAVLLLLGVADTAAGKSTDDRRNQAATVLGTTSSSLVRYHEEGLLGEIVDQLLVLNAEDSPDGLAAPESGHESVGQPGEGADELEIEVAAPSLDNLEPNTPEVDDERFGIDAVATAAVVQRPRGEQEERPLVSGDAAKTAGTRARRSHRLLIAVGISLPVVALVASLAATSTWPFNSASPSTHQPSATPASATTKGVDSIKVLVGLPGQSSTTASAFAHIRAGDPVGWGIVIDHGAVGELHNTSIIDQVPKGVIVVPGSVRLINGNFPKGYTFPNSVIQANGTKINVNIGDYLPEAKAGGAGTAYVTFTTEFVSLSPNNCARHVIVDTAWLGTTQYPASLHASARAEVSC